jgi:2-polyprenyl-6-methoxyphenol hydroxylase-like FAD-dependent oxidoreductase
MGNDRYDAIVVGGGLGGAALAKVLAESGLHLLVLEREPVFRDRVRGEAILPWGVAEARALGIADALLRDCGQEIGWWDYSVAPALDVPTSRRDLIATTPDRAGFLTFYHPAMQRRLLDLAEGAGAEVRRGAAVVAVRPGQPPEVRVRQEGREEGLRPRLVIGADGRASRLRVWGGFAVQRDPERLVVASTLLRGLRLPEDSLRMVMNSPIGQSLLVVPIGEDRFRAYLMYRKRGARRHLSGEARMGEFVRACVDLGTPADWFASVEPIGPLAEFEGADTWVDHPYRDGIVLVGDAAAAPDPTFGCGLALTLRDVRVLSDRLLGDVDWEAAAHAYAAEHDRDYGVLHRVESWLTDLFYEVGPEADARRARALPCLVVEPDRLLDLIGVGPELPSDENARRRLFAED